MYKLKGFISLVTIVSLVDWAGSQYVVCPALLNFNPGPFSFVKIWAWAVGRQAYAGFYTI